MKRFYAQKFSQHADYLIEANLAITHHSRVRESVSLRLRRMVLLCIEGAEVAGKAFGQTRLRR